MARRKRERTQQENPMSKTKKTIVGAGAVGGLITAALTKAGHHVTVLARTRTLDALRTNGLRIVSAEGEKEERIAVDATSDATSPGVQDFVVIALKAQALPALAPTLEPLVGPDTVIVAAMNGLPWWFLDGFTGPLEGQHLEAVDPGAIVSRSLPARQSIGCVVHLSSATIGPGVVKRGKGNLLIVGASSNALSGRARAFADDLRDGGFEVESTETIRQAFWIKLWGNMNMNPISALTGSTADRILDDPLTYALVERMMEEAASIGERLGLSYGMSIADRIAVARKLGAFKTSMLQDLEASRPLELMPILGVFPELGRKLGVPTPFCDAVLGLLRQRAVNSGLA
jgi:2-dehydropantoate 2-reductase